MPSIDLNYLSKASFKNLLDVDKNRLSFSELDKNKSLLIDNLIDNAKILENYTDIKEKEIIFKILKVVLALCYIYNINLNDYIQVQLKDEDNSTINTRKTL